jgi:hypothetical protein
MSPSTPSASAVAVSTSYSAWRSSPFTSTFSVRGNVTPYVVEQNSWISSAVPGSWPRNWLHGTPSTVKPRSAYFFWRFSSPVYCGVSPHFDATFTSKTAVSLYCDRSAGEPSSAWMETS